MRLYAYYYGHNGDALTTRPLLRRLKELGHEVAVGCFSNHAYLFADLGVEVAVAPFDDAGGRTSDEVREYHRDRAMFADKLVSAWCGTYPDLDEKYGHSWANIAETFNRQLGSCELDILDLDPSDVPMLSDWPMPNDWNDFGSKSVYVENGPVRSEHCAYEFNMGKLSRAFPKLSFYCTWHVNHTRGVYDCSGKNLMELSRMSDKCAAIIGKGSGPFFATFTKFNRTKPRCVVGYEPKAPHRGPFWPYPGQDTTYAKMTEELYSFLEKL